MLEDAPKDVVITSIMFNESAIEISYLEIRDQSEHAGLIKTLLLERNKFPAVEEIHDDVVELVDSGLLEIRNPAKSLNPRERLSRRQSQDVETSS